jgi:hypothetical protein
MAAVTWTVSQSRITETAVEGKRLGRHVYHDSRNRAYPWRQADRKLTSQLWPRHIPILDQGNVGSCTGEEETGSLGTGPVWDALSAGQQATLTQTLAYQIYSFAETIDGDGPYPPNDNGSSGPSAAQVAKNLGYISGYLHCFSLADVLDALETGPVGIGSNWYTSMDNPDSSGLVTVSGSVRGGHEYLCRGKNVDTALLYFDNSWGTGFGLAGSFSMSYGSLTRLLSEQGDATVSLPLTVPVPTPVPVPVSGAADTLLYNQTRQWASGRHVGENRQIARDLRDWYAAKGF